jgi:cyclopropane fatty-acyl-phospholipid synthase-like methyltransferase
MLRMANVGPHDVAYDLGSGDGRTVIAAVKEFDATRGVGVELDADRIQEGNENA